MGPFDHPIFSGPFKFPKMKGLTLIWVLGPIKHYLLLPPALLAEKHQHSSLSSAPVRMSSFPRSVFFSNTMRAIHSSLNFYLKPMFLSHSSLSLRKFAVPKQLLNPRNLCALASADSNNGGRSGALSPSPVLEEVQKIDVNPPKGTRDFPPEEMRLRNWLFNNFREVRILFLC